MLGPLYCSLPYLLRQGFLLHPAAVTLARGANMQAPGFLLPLSSQHWQDHMLLGFSVDSGLYACVASTLLIEFLSPGSHFVHIALSAFRAPIDLEQSSLKLHFLGTLMEGIWSLLEKWRLRVLHTQKFSNRVFMHVQGCRTFNYKYIFFKSSFIFAIQNISILFSTFSLSNIYLVLYFYCFYF